MKPQTRTLLALLAEVDWPRALQRSGVLLRKMRGDDAQTIQGDHELELQRGEGLHRVITDTMRRAVGCVAPAACKCSFCEGKVVS
jgi:hypothetical protein